MHIIRAQSIVAVLLLALPCLVLAGPLQAERSIGYLFSGPHRIYPIKGYPITITLRNQSESKKMVINHINDWPLHSVKTDCPKGPVEINECWFVLYEDEFE